MPINEIASGVPVLSLTLDDADLNDPAKGLLPNKREHGEEWEREGSVSYFEDGKLRFASGVGVRIHGGGSRITAPRPGFRLYFRRKYGPREVPPGVFFSPAAQPVRRIVVHDDVRRDGKIDWYFANPLAYDIASCHWRDCAGDEARALLPERRILRPVRRDRAVRRAIFRRALGLRRHPAEPGGDEQAVGLGARRLAR